MYLIAKSSSKMSYPWGEVLNYLYWHLGIISKPKISARLDVKVIIQTLQRPYGEPWTQQKSSLPRPGSFYTLKSLEGGGDQEQLSREYEPNGQSLIQFREKNQYIPECHKAERRYQGLWFYCSSYRMSPGSLKTVCHSKKTDRESSFQILLEMTVC